MAYDRGDNRSNQSIGIYDLAYDRGEIIDFLFLTLTLTLTLLLDEIHVGTTL